MAASSGGGGGASLPPGQVPPNPPLTPCMWCKTPLPHPATPFCNACGRPQKKCIKCSNPIPPSYQLCPYCHAPQHETKVCLNPQCKKPLFPGAAFCFICQAPQDPAMLQQFLTVGQCISCSTQLVIPGQLACHICGMSQHSQTSSMEHSGQLMVHSSQRHPPHMFQPPLNLPQSPSRPSLNLPQPSNMARAPFHQHPQQPLQNVFSPHTEQQHLSHEQQSAKRSPESDGHLANKRSRSEQASNGNSQTFIDMSGAVVRRQVPQTQFTSPPTAASAQGTPAHPAHVHVPPGYIGTPQSEHYPVDQGASQPSYPLPATQRTGHHPATQGTASSGTQDTSQPGHYPAPQGTPQTSYPPSTQGTLQPSYPPSTQGTLQPSYPPSTQGTPQPSYPPSTQRTSQPSYPPSIQGTPQPSYSPATQGTPQPSYPPSTQGTPQPSYSPATQGTHQPSYPPSTQGTPQPSYFPSTQGTPQPSYSPATQGTPQPSYPPATQGTPQPSYPPATQGTPQPSYSPATQGTPQPSYSPATQITPQPSYSSSTQGTPQPSNSPATQGTPQPSYPQATQGIIPQSGHHPGTQRTPSQTGHHPATQGTASPGTQDNSQPEHYPAIQGTPYQGTTSQSVAPVNTQAHLGPTLPHDSADTASAPKPKSITDQPPSTQETWNLPQQPWVKFKTEVDQEKERKRNRVLLPTPQSGDSDSESISLKKRRSEPSEPEKPRSEPEKPRPEPEKSRSEPEKSRSDPQKPQPEPEKPRSETEKSHFDQEKSHSEQETPSPAVNNESSPAHALPSEKSSSSSYDGPDLSKEDDKILPARASPLERSSSFSSDASLDLSNSEYDTPHGSQANTEEDDTSSSSQSSSPCQSPVPGNSSEANSDPVTNMQKHVSGSEKTNLQGATDEPKDNQKKQECINNLNITTESKQSQQHKDTAADTSVHSDLPTAAQQQSMNNNKSRESQKEPGAATSSHDPLTKHTGSSDGNGEEASAMSGEKDSSKKEDFTPAVKKKKAKKKKRKKTKSSDGKSTKNAERSGKSIKNAEGSGAGPVEEQKKASTGGSYASVASSGKKLLQNGKEQDQPTSADPDPFAQFRPQSMPLHPLLNPLKDKAMTVKFCAILPREAWEWDKDSAVYIQFILGEKLSDVGPGTIGRDVGDGLSIVKFTVQMHVDLFTGKEGIFYKYVVFSRRMEEVGHPYEYLHGAPYGDGGFTNRVLRVPKNKHIPGALIRQFDTMIYPEIKDNSWLNRAKYGLSGIFGSGPDHPRFNVPPPHKMREQCLKIYLEPCKRRLLNGEFIANFDIQNVVMEFTDRYNCCAYQCYGHAFVSDWDHSMTNVIKEWLQTFILELDQSSLDRTSKLVTAVVVMCYAHRVCPNTFTGNLCVTLLKMMVLRPSGADFDFLTSLMKETNSRHLVTAAMTFVLNQTILNIKEEYVIHLLKAYPLLHLLRGDCVPNEQTIFRPSAIKWTELTDPLRRTEHMMHHKKEFMKEHFQELQELFLLDHLLLFIVGYVCPKSDISDFCDHIRIPYAIALVCKRLEKYQSLSTSGSSEINDVLCRPLSVLQYRINQVESFEMEELDHCLEAAHFLIIAVQQRLREIDDIHKKSIKSLIALMLYLMTKLDTVQSSQNTTEDLKHTRAGMKSNALEKISCLLKKSMQRGRMGVGFGFGVYCSTEPELELWQSLLELRCPTSVEQDWHGVVKTILTDRVKQLTPENRVDRFLELERRANTPALITNIFITEATTALDEIVFRRPTTHQYKTSGNTGYGYSSFDFDKFTNYRSAHVVNLLGKILMRKYPTFKGDLPLDDLLEWDLWPAYVSIYAREANITKKDSGGEWQFICACAISKLQDACKKICSGDICMHDLKLLNSKIGQTHKLCSATTVDGKEQPEMPSADAVITSLEQRLEEYEQFEEYRKQLSNMLSYLTSVGLQGRNPLLDILRTDFSRCNVNKLCTSVNKRCVVQYFPSAAPLEPFMKKFSIMTQECKIFVDFWYRRVTTIVQNRSADLALSDVDKELWTPVFSQCVKLLAKLKDYSLSLQEVDQLFKGQVVKDITGNIKQLCRGVELCENDRNVKDFEWMEGVVDRMNQFWTLCSFAEAADAFLKIRYALNLTGDFKLVEQVASRATSSMKDQTLQAIDESVVTAAKFLEDFANDPKKRECLRAYAESQSIVKWIREETKDVNDLQNFVNISLATAAGGEDAYTRDKLSNLRTVGSGFGALIYRLPPDAGYETLVDRCKSLWDTLRSASNLPYMMRDCAKTIDWYQSVKETQGSVEVTSYGQMNNINRYGSYTIGSGRKNIHTSQSQVIRLTLSGSEKRLPKNNYSLDDLSDLESKLVLITGPESSEIKDVEVFLQSLMCVRRIADALMALQQYGSGDYIGWEMSFPCALPNVVEELQKVASKMEDDLEKWKQEIQEKRDEFYELNYYTTQQLLLLREELGRLKEPGEDQVKPHAMALLQSISREVSADAMKRYVQEVTTILEQQGAMTSTGVKTERKKVNNPVSSFSQLSGQETAAPAAEASSALMTGLLESEGAKTSAPLAQTQENELTNDLRVILVNLHENFDFHRQLILLAFERCDNSGDQNEVCRWCLDNQDNFKYEEEKEPMKEEEEETQKRTLMHSDKDDGEEDVVSIKEVTADSAPPPAEVVVGERVAVDEHHPVVRRLLDLDYPLDKCLDAAERFPEDSHAAHEYLQQTGEQGYIFGEEEVEPSRPAAAESHEGAAAYVGNSTVSNLEIVKCQTKAYLTLLELGMVLHVVRDDYPSPVLSKRPFSDKVLKIGEPNLLVTPPDNVIKTTLALYMEGGDQSLPMPTYEEVLVCSEWTTDEEVTLLWKRAINDPSNFRLFCLVHAERLSYQVCDRALWFLNQLSQGQKDYRIVIICSSEEEEKSHVISKLLLFRRPFSALQPNTSFADYLLRHFKRWPEAFYQKGPSRAVVASVVDPDKSYVRVVTSQRAGMGKSLYIKRRREALKAATTHSPHEVIVPIHGPVVTADTVVGALKEHIGKSRPIIFHLDIAPSVLWQVDSILFCLLVLQGLCDSQGNVWRCHPAHLYMIESTIPKGGEGKAASRTTTLFKLLPSVECVSPRHLNAVQLQSYCVPMDEAEFRSHTYQRVYQYLRRHIAQISLDRFSYQSGSVEGNTADCLLIMLSECGVKDPSWVELNHFLKFLDIQLSSCEKSLFCNEDIVCDVMSGLKTFVVKFMIRMSKDFATSSLKGEVATENEEEAVMGTLEEYTIAERKEWEKNYHPYLFFNRDGFSMTFVGFNANKDGDLIDPVKNACIEGLERVVGAQLQAGLIQNQVNLSENYQLWNKMTMMQKMSLVMGLEYVTDPDSSYVLTVDNVIKILAIQMRFRCNIPVVVMGETGCGKTRLIRFMCDMIALSAGGGKDSIRNMLIIKVHGGTTEQDVRNKVLEAEELAKLNKGKGIDTILFFDEANTTEAIGLIKEVMCDRRVYGREISQDVNFIAACNPYRKHTDKMIGKLESAGLGFYVKATETQQKLGQIPLRQLVYRVLELPLSMRPLVYDFGQLTNTTEQDYTGQIVINHCSETLSQQVITAVSRVLVWCQKFMRERKDECSFVSLRDVERAMVVFKFFIEKMSLFKDLIAAKAKDEDDKTPLQDAPTWALVLALSICYHARLQDRNDFECEVVQQFSPPLALTGRVQQFKDEIRWCQEVLLENMLLGRNIAKNAALRENVFMMTISIELRIPLFLVGKPGSSKTLAKSIVADSMHGRASEKELLKHFKEVHMFSYQCSQLSTPESVIEVFNTAKSFQEKQDTSKFVSIVVLDEVGLAEDSPNLPLKALHPLLEDGTEGADDSKQIVAREKRVAFIGISNWALDPAKMNRGVMVTRGDPDRMELELSARGICSNEENDPVKKRLDRFFAPLADSYIEICRQQEQQFYGLRDFYSLVKMLYWMCEKTLSDPTNKQLEHAIKRNFGGHEKVNAFEIFKLNIPQLDETESQQNEDMSEKQRAVMYPDCSPLGLIRTSLKTKETTWHGENRYLLFLTENYAALQVLKRYLQEVVGLPAASSGPVDEAGELEGPSVEQIERQRKKEQRKMEPFVLFGSSFPKDREYTQVCRNINQIMICMETGRTVILLNLDNLYESLYDLLNQYYIMLGGNRYVDLGLQTHRVKCRVHQDFKLILIAEKDTVYEKFPIPLINRLEKHFVFTRTVLLSWQERVLDSLVEWVKQFSRVGKFTEKDSFVGYQNDTPASVVFQATEQLREDQDWNVDEAMEESEEWLDMVMERSKNLLIQMASPDALIRFHSINIPEIEEGKKNITSAYTDQCHTSIKDFLCHHLQLHHEMEEKEGGFLLHVTTHSHLLSTTEMVALGQELEFSRDQIKWFRLQEFDTEMDFSNKIKLSFERRSQEDSLLIVQCDSGHLYGDLIACARYRVDDEREKSSSRWSADYGRTHVLFIIHLPRRGGDGDGALGSFVSFQGGKWLSAHIDDLRAPSEAALSLEDALHTSISNLFYCEGAVQSIAENVEEEEGRVDDEGRTEMTNSSGRRESYQCFRLYSCIQAAVARAVDSDKSKQWAIRRVNILLDLIPQQPTFPLVNDESLFYAGLVKHIHSILKEKEEVMGEETGWVLNEAMSRKKLQSGGTFRNVLSRKLDEVIIPIFAEVLVSVDRYSNLDLVRTKSLPHIRQLWLSAFPVLCKFSYADMTTQGGDGLAGMGQMRSMGSEFHCQFPFFWLVKETVDSHWDNAISVTGGHRQQVHQYLCEQLAGTDIREVLESVNEEDWKDLYQRYLRDYVRCVHQVTHKQGAMEYLLIEAALDAIITSPDLSPPNSPHPPLLSRVAAVHTAYHHYQRELLWFGCLTSRLPGVLISLQDITHNPDRLELHLQAVRMVLDDDLIPPLTMKTKKHLPQWLVWMQLCQNAIDSILTLGQETELATKLYAQWQRVRAVQMFAEHIITKYYNIGLETYGKRLDFSLETGCDFTKDGTVAIVQKTLQAMEGEIEKKKKLDKQAMNSIRESCRSFFMELVSTLCFGQTTLPEPDLIKRLMNIVFKDNEKTKDFTYSDKAAADKQPVIRSFLLQLLLEHDTECVRVHLEEYFERSQSCHIVEVNHLSMLCIQCFEDALFKQHTQHTLQQRINHSLQLPKDGSEGMVSHFFPTLPYLEAVAKLRYSLSVVAELLHTQLTAGRGEGGHCHTHDAHLLIEETKQCCSNPQLNQEEAGPGVYLVKLLMRRYGPSFLSTLTSDPALQWVVPEHLRQSDDKESQRMDMFVIYNPHYPQLRTALLDAAYGQQRDGLKESCQGLTPDVSVPILLAVYEIVTNSHSYRQQSKHIDDEVIGEISSFTKNLTILNRELKWTAETLIRNTQGGKLDALCCRPGHSPHNILLSAVVVHTAITIYSRSTLDIMLPLFNMVEKPGGFQQAYLPTMPQDALPEARRILGGSFFECASGHPYFISEYGRPWVESTCPVCGSGIGGKSHTLKSDNKVARQNDTTQTGYALGPPEQRETIPSPERSLSPAACAVLRAIMHSALLWATCNNENAMEGLIQLTHAAVRPPDMAGFFWRHLEHDITILGQAVGKSKDDVCLLLHLILKNMATKTPASSSGMQIYASLLAANAREQWEKCFEQEYIQPVLAGLDKQMGDAMNLIVNDKKEDRDRLFYTVYEKSSLPSSSLLPHLWTYRSRITLEHLFQTLQAQKMKDTCPILHEFLKEEPILRATRYLPELVQLQKQMFEFSHRRLDRKEAAKLPVRDYIKSLTNEHKRNQFCEQLKCVKIVWELVKDKLSEYARVHVPENYLGMVISEELKVEWFIPTLTGPGVVTVAMLDLLVGAHNDFIEKSRAVLKKGQKTDMSLKEQKVPVSHIQLCHLLDYEHQLLSIVLSHCRYLLRHGHGQDIRYDLPALEKHIVDRFIHGKPLLMLEIPQVVYRRDVYTATSFANIRKKVSPQIKLSLREQQDIVAELKTVQKIRDCLDVVEIVMGFLASGGQKAENHLDNYLETALKMKHRFNCKKALEYCCLGHVLSLWETLSVELAKLLTLTDQEPFDSLHDNYLVELGDKEKELNGVLAKCDLPVLLCTLYEFIETNVRHREPREHDRELVDTLEAHLDQYSLPQLPDLKQLPADITIGKAVSTWKHVVIYQHKKTNTTPDH